MERIPRKSEFRRPRKITKADKKPVLGSFTNADFIRATGMDLDAFNATYGRGVQNDTSRSRAGGSCDDSFGDS